MKVNNSFRKHLHVVLCYYTNCDFPEVNWEENVIQAYFLVHRI